MAEGPNPGNDRGEVFQRADGDWDWRRLDGANGKVVATSGGQGYVDEQYALAAARAYNDGVEFVVVRDALD